MKKVYFIGWIVFTFLCGCSPSGDQEQVTADLQVAPFEPATATSSSLWNPTRTPLLEPSETASPAPFSTPSMDLSQITLEEKDLSDDFYAIPPIMVGITKSTIQNWYSETDIEVVDAFFFTDDREERYIIGWIIQLPERLERTGFDTVMRHHEYVLVNAVAELGGEEILQRDLLEIGVGLGNNSQGLRLLVKEEGGPYQFWVDAILF